MGDNFFKLKFQVKSKNSENLFKLCSLSDSTMKPPKLPGTEKFKFSDKKYTEYRKGSINSEKIESSVDSSNFIRGISSRSTCPTTTSMTSFSSQPHFSRTDSRRKPILPISSRMTSRVLTLTHLPLDTFDIRDSRGRHNYTNGAKISVPCDSRVPTNTTSTSRVSLFSDYSGSHCSSSQPSPRSLCSPLDRSLTPSQWAKNAHRLSTSSQSSWEDCPETHESFWISRKK